MFINGNPVVEPLLTNAPVAQTSLKPLPSTPLNTNGLYVPSPFVIRIPPIGAEEISIGVGEVEELNTSIPLLKTKVTEITGVIPILLEAGPPITLTIGIIIITITRNNIKGEKTIVTDSLSIW